MTVELKQHYVAFLDVLGFSEMVKSDLVDDNHLYLSKLFKCHQRAAEVFSDDPNCFITQFSDSIVISKPYEEKSFEWFATRVAKYQRILLDERLLCRGGIAVNKHFSNGSFTFSAGLIEAYHVESKIARYPRVVISPELIDLVFPEKKEIPEFLVQEDDGMLFIDYVGLTQKQRPKTLVLSITDVVTKLLMNENPSLREKGIWLATYSDSTLKTKLAPKKFVGKMIIKKK